MSTVLRDPTILKLSPPVRLRAVGLDETTMCIYFSDRRDNYDILDRVEDTNLLYSVLSCVMEKECWQEYVYTNLMLFEWEFNGYIINSCSPFYELLMRCMRKLIMIYNGLTQKKCLAETNELDILVTQMNLAFNGIADSIQDDDTCLSVFQPALFFPPYLRSEHGSCFKKRGAEIAPGISVHTLQMILYMILSETWFISLEESIRKMMLYRNTDLIDRVDHLTFLVTNLYKDVLKTPYGAFKNDTNYQTYIHSRYDPYSVMSDLNRIHLLAKAFTMEKKDIIFHEQSLVSIAHTFVPDIYLQLRSIVKLNPKFFLKGIKKTVHITIFEKCQADDYFATAYEKPEDGGGNIEMGKMLTLPDGNIPLHVEAYPNVSEDSQEEIFTEKKKTLLWFQCFLK